jgi:AraC-like DNA-binding protein
MARKALDNSRLNCITDWQARAGRARYRVSPLAKECGVSPRHLERFFWLKRGERLRAWLTEQRLTRVTASLQQAMFVKETADQAGFHDPTAFTRWFVKECGVAPSAFRSAFPPPASKCPLWQGNVRSCKANRFAPAAPLSENTRYEKGTIPYASHESSHLGNHPMFDRRPGPGHAGHFRRLRRRQRGRGPVGRYSPRHPAQCRRWEHSPLRHHLGPNGLSWLLRRRLSRIGHRRQRGRS